MPLFLLDNHHYLLLSTLLLCRKTSQRRRWRRRWRRRRVNRHARLLYSIFLRDATVAAAVAAVMTMPAVSPLAPS